jgi:hypothetical protein
MTWGSVYYLSFISDRGLAANFAKLPELLRGA